MLKGSIRPLTSGIVVAYAIAAIAPNMEIANATLPAYLASTACVCGFFILCERLQLLLKFCKVPGLYGHRSKGVREYSS